MIIHRDNDKKAKTDRKRWINLSIIAVFIVLFSLGQSHRNKQLKEVLLINAVVSKKTHYRQAAGIYYPLLVVGYTVNDKYYIGDLHCSKKFYDEVEICDTVDIFVSKKNPEVFDWSEKNGFRPYIKQ